MILVDMKCSSCEDVFEYMQKNSDDVPTKCTNCGSENTIKKAVSYPAGGFFGLDNSTYCGHRKIK